jgi:hypothetical protein
MPDPSTTHTFLFADLAGFTAMTEAHGDEEAADLAGEFCRAVRALLADHRAEEVKTIGDAMMIRAEDPSQAVELGLRIVEEVGAQHGFPAVRVGINTGPAVERDGDWFGRAKRRDAALRRHRVPLLLDGLCAGVRRRAGALRRAQRLSIARAAQDVGASGSPLALDPMGSAAAVVARAYT